VFAVSTLWLASAGLAAASNGKTPFLWAFVFHVFSNVGWLYFVPTAIALFARVAPKQINATMVGFFFFGVFLGSVISGRLGGLYEQLPASQFWALHAALVGSGGVAILAIGQLMRRATLPA